MYVKSPLQFVLRFNFVYIGIFEYMHVDVYLLLFDICLMQVSVMELAIQFQLLTLSLTTFHRIVLSHLDVALMW